MTIDQFRETLRRPDFSHVSYRSWCGKDILWIYRCDADSPTKCIVIGGIDDTAESRRVLAEEGTRAVVGGERGHASCVAGMR